MTEHILTAT